MPHFYAPTNQGERHRGRLSLSSTSHFFRGEDQSGKYDPLLPQKRSSCVCVCVCILTYQNKRKEASQCACLEVDTVSVSNVIVSNGNERLRDLDNNRVREREMKQICLYGDS